MHLIITPVKRERHKDNIAYTSSFKLPFTHITIFFFFFFIIFLAIANSMYFFILSTFKSMHVDTKAKFFVEFRPFNCLPQVSKSIQFSFKSQFYLHYIFGIFEPLSSNIKLLLSIEKLQKITMESEQIAKKDMKVEIPTDSELMSSMSRLTRQPSGAKSNCLCSPTTHAGSFRCRLHRSPSLQRTRSMDSTSFRDSTSKANTTTADTTRNENTVQAQQ